MPQEVMAKWKSLSIAIASRDTLILLLLGGVIYMGWRLMAHDMTLMKEASARMQAEHQAFLGEIRLTNYLISIRDGERPRLLAPPDLQQRLAPSAE